MFEAMRYHKENPQCYQIDTMEESVKKVLTTETLSLCMDQVMVSSVEKIEDESNMKQVSVYFNFKQHRMRMRQEKLRNQAGLSNKIIQFPQKDPELKELPNNLKYVFLAENPLQLEIIRNSLSELEEKKLLRVLRNNKKALDWSVSNLKGISPTYCMHKIKLEEDFKPVVQPQRRLNPNMKEGVRK